MSGKKNRQFRTTEWCFRPDFKKNQGVELIFGEDVHHFNLTNYIYYKKVVYMCGVYVVYMWCTSSVRGVDVVYILG